MAYCPTISILHSTHQILKHRVVCLLQILFYVIHVWRMSGQHPQHAAAHYQRGKAGLQERTHIQST